MIRIALVCAVVVLSTAAHALDYKAMEEACNQITGSDREWCMSYVTDARKSEQDNRADHARSMTNLSIVFPWVWELSDEVLNTKKPRR